MTQTMVTCIASLRDERLFKQHFVLLEPHYCHVTCLMSYVPYAATVSGLPLLEQQCEGFYCCLQYQTCCCINMLVYYVLFHAHMQVSQDCFEEG